MANPRNHQVSIIRDKQHVINSKSRGDLSDIRVVSKQPPDTSTIIRMNRCKISCLTTNNSRQTLNKYLVSICVQHCMVSRLISIHRHYVNIPQRILSASDLEKTKKFTLHAQGADRTREWTRTQSGCSLYYSVYPYTPIVTTTLQCVPLQTQGDHHATVCTLTHPGWPLYYSVYPYMPRVTTVLQSGCSLYYSVYPYTVRVLTVLQCVPLHSQGAHCTTVCTLTRPGWPLHYSVYPYTPRVTTVLQCGPLHRQGNHCTTHFIC